MFDEIVFEKNIDEGLSEIDAISDRSFFDKDLITGDEAYKPQAGTKRSLVKKTVEDLKTKVVKKAIGELQALVQKIYKKLNPSKPLVQLEHIGDPQPSAAVPKSATSTQATPKSSKELLQDINQCKLNLANPKTTKAEAIKNHQALLKAKIDLMNMIVKKVGGIPGEKVFDLKGSQLAKLNEAESDFYIQQKTEQRIRDLFKVSMDEMALMHRYADLISPEDPDILREAMQDGFENLSKAMRSMDIADAAQASSLVSDLEDTKKNIQQLKLALISALEKKAGSAALSTMDQQVLRTLKKEFPSLTSQLEIDPLDPQVLLADLFVEDDADNASVILTEILTEEKPKAPAPPPPRVKTYSPEDTTTAKQDHDVDALVLKYQDKPKAFVKYLHDKAARKLSAEQIAYLMPMLNDTQKIALSTTLANAKDKQIFPTKIVQVFELASLSDKIQLMKALSINLQPEIVQLIEKLFASTDSKGKIAIFQAVPTLQVKYLAQLKNEELDQAFAGLDLDNQMELLTILSREQFNRIKPKLQEVISQAELEELSDTFRLFDQDYFIKQIMPKLDECLRGINESKFKSISTKIYKCMPKETFAQYYKQSDALNQKGLQKSLGLII